MDEEQVERAFPSIKSIIEQSVNGSIKESAKEESLIAESIAPSLSASAAAPSISRSAVTYHEQSSVSGMRNLEEKLNKERNERLKLEEEMKRLKQQSDRLSNMLSEAFFKDNE